MWGALRRRPVLLVSLAAGLLAALVAWASGARPTTRMLVGWDAAAAAYVGPILWMLWPATPDAMAAKAAEQDEGKWTVLALSVTAALASILAVAGDLAASKGTPEAGSAAALAGGTVLLSWVFVQVLFAHHYAHEFWLKGEGLAFPGNDRPDFPEFLYLALTVGMTAQVSDTTTNSAAMRRLVMGHAALAFLFNAVVLAATVNLAAALVG